MTFLAMAEDLLQRLERFGLRRGLIEQKDFPKLGADTPTLDFSGWPMYTHQNTPDLLVTDFLPRSGSEQRSNPLGGEGSLTSRTNGA